MKLHKFATPSILMLILISIYSVNAKSQAEGFDFRQFVMKNFKNANEYFLEIMLVLFLVIYGVNYWLGKKANEKYAEKWIQENVGTFRKEFPDVGVANSETGSLLESESANYFKFYASGRRNCPYARVIIELKARQNILNTLIFGIFWPEKDRIRVEIPISLASSLPFIFAVVRRKEAKFVHQNYPDIKAFCQSMTCDELEKKYIVLGEHAETSEYILSDRVIATLRKHNDIIEMISFTDLNAPHKQLLRADMVAPHSVLKDPKEFNEILETLFYLVDRVACYKMSPNCRSKADKERQLYQKNQDKGEKKTQDKKEVSSKKKDENKEESRRKLQKKVL